MPWTNEEAERVRTIEVSQADLKTTVEGMDSKLDDLLALKNKGLGAFWLAAIIISAVFTAAVTFVSNYFRS